MEKINPCCRFLLIAMVICLLSTAGRAQYSISGGTCVAAGATVAPYTLTGTPFSSGDKWCITNGTVVTSQGSSTTCIASDGTANVSVTWGVSGTGTLSYYHPASAATPSASLTVNITTKPTSSPSTLFVPSGMAYTISYTSLANPSGCGTPYSSVIQYSPSSGASISSTSQSGSPATYTITGTFTGTPITVNQVFSSTTMSGTITVPIANIIPQTPFTPGTVTPASQCFVNSGTSATLTATTPTNSIYGPNFNYQWQKSGDGNTWTNITGATSLTYSPGAVSVTTFYRQAITAGPLTEYTSAVSITVTPSLDAGVISTSPLVINYNTAPGTINCSAASGGGCSVSYAYQWQQSSNGSSWTNVPIGSDPGTNLNYTPGPLIGSAYFRRQVTGAGTTLATSSILVTVYPALVAPVVSPASQTISAIGTPTTLTRTGASGGNGTYTYQWQVSYAPGGPYTAIDGATGTTLALGNPNFTAYYQVMVTSNGASVTSIPVVVAVMPALSGGTISPSLLTVTSGTSPGLITANPASGGYCTGSYAYVWQQSTDGVNFSSTGITTQNYTPGNLSTTTYFRRQATCGAETAYTTVSTITVGTIPSSADMNYVRTRTISKPGVTDTGAAAFLTDPFDVQQVTQYMDGLGRPVQTVARQASPLLKDIVSFQVYDPFGREPIKYLPYVSGSQDGNFRTNAQAEQRIFNTAQFSGEQFYYSLTDIEASPLNRPLNMYSPGLHWTGNNKGTTSEYLYNDLSDSVQIWNISTTAGNIPLDAGTYPTGQLYKNTTINELGRWTVEYKDKDGNVVLKKMQLWDNPAPGHSGWACTYYVYDDLNNLRFVLQPKGVVWLQANSWNFTASGGSTVLTELCFRYEYDQRRRIITKRVPGSGSVNLVYDARDRLVMSQDSLQYGLGKWLVTEYDSLDRPWRTGLLTDAGARSTHQTNASSSITYPNTSGGNYEVLTQTFYDNYTGIAAASPSLGSTLATTYTSNSNFFITSYNSYPVYAVPVTAWTNAVGLVTGTMAKVINSSPATYLYTVNFYDDHARLIQVRTLNYTGGVDTTTTQYDFNGKQLRHLLNHQKNGTSAQHYNILTKLSYDAGSRLKNMYKNIDGASSDQLIDSIQYNELRQIRAKYLGNAIDSLVYDFNIQGWMTEINKGYLTGTTNHYFGMELAYDNSISAVGTTTYANPTYTGNIAGLIWKSAGDGVARKYDFSYDNANRLIGANFVQNTTGSSWDNSYINYSVNNLTYDANGNILSMKQSGFKLGGSSPVDQLQYNYQTTSNKLLMVYDTVDDVNSKLGDFHYNPTGKGATDYTYDGNGNLQLDNNKAITSITYNYLNQPQTILINGKGSIVYWYDGAGNKLKKDVIDATITPQKTTSTLYIGGIVYQNDTIQFIGNEEGRTRWAFHKYTNGTTAYKWEYDYFEKDHLGNTRVVLSQQKDTAQYVATLEAANRNTESQLFYNLTGYARASASGYPVDYTYGNPNDSVTRLNGSGTKVGPGIVLKVMSGDKVDLSVQYFFNGTGTNSGNLTSNDLLNSLASGIVSITSGAHGSFSDLTGGISPLPTALTSFITSNNTAQSGKPQAFLNWILLDDQFKIVATYPQSSALPVLTAGITAGGTLQPPLAFTGIPITKSGYLYIYVSNATPGWDVFFDNLSVKTYSGPLLEETHYYPFGLQMNGISDKALKSKYAENKFRYNGKELQNNEFSDGTGLEWVDYGQRMFDSQLGRFFTQDRFADKFSSLSPYQYAANDPIRNIDVNGDSVWTTTNTVKNADGSTTIRHTTHITGKFLDLSGVKKGGGGCSPAKDARGDLAAGINQRFNRERTEAINNKTNTTEVWDFDAQFTVANSMDDVSESDHLLVVVDKMNGNADPTLGGGPAGGVAPLKGKIGYIENSSNMEWLIESGVHEIGHNLGLGQPHEPYGTHNYESYDQQRWSFYPIQIMQVFNMANNGALNQGSNSQRSVQGTNNWLWHTSTNDEPYKLNTKPGERIPKVVHNNN